MHFKSSYSVCSVVRTVAPECVAIELSRVRPVAVDIHVSNRVAKL